MKKFLRINNKKYRIQETYRDALSEFNRSLKLIVDIELLKNYIATRIKQITNSKQVYFFLVNNELNRFFVNGDPQWNRDIYFTLNDKLIYWLTSNETHLNLTKNPDIKTFFTKRENEILEKLNAKFIYPIRVMNQTKGLVILTNKTDGKSYLKEEINLLSALIDQTSFAMENAFLYQQQADRLKRMYHADRMSIMGQLAAGAAHEIRNPLTSIRSTIQFINRDIQDPQKKQLVNNLIGEVDRINEIIQGLLSFSRPSLPQMETIHLDKILTETIQLVLNTASKKGIKITFNKNTQATKIEADPAQLKQVFLNILINAIQAIHEDGEITISIDDNESAREVSHAIKEEIYIVVSDNGTGIEEDNIEKIFDPFYTTKGDGTGLGLSISYGIINRHGGDIKVKSKIGLGTTVVLSLPNTNS